MFIISRQEYFLTSVPKSMLWATLFLDRNHIIKLRKLDKSNGRIQNKRISAMELYMRDGTSL